MSSLDFAVIGFEKCGTNSLRKWLQSQPNVYIPDYEHNYCVAPPFNSKEVQHDKNGKLRPPTNDEVDPPFWRKYNSGILGIVNPHLAMGNYYESADKLYKEGTKKILTIEKDPRERAKSSWAALKTVGVESRPFEVAYYASSVIPRTQEKNYIETYWNASAYAPILYTYKQIFGKENVLSVPLEKLSINHINLKRYILEFLEIDGDFEIPFPWENRNPNGDS